VTALFLDGPRLARRLIAVRILAFWNRAFRKATLGQRLLWGLGVAGAATFLVLVLWAPQAGGVAVARGRLGAGQAGTVRAILGIGLLGYTAVLLYGSLLFSVSALLLDRDLEMLLVSPYPVAAVLGAKIWVRVVGLFATAALVLLPLLVGLPIVTGRPLAILVGLLVLAATPLLPVSLMSLLVMVAIRLVPASRGREVVGLLAITVAIGIEILNIGLNPTYGAARSGRSGRQLLAGLSQSAFAAPPFLPHGWGARAVADALFAQPLAATGWTALIVAAGLLAVWASVSLSARIYVSGWSEYAPRRRRAVAAAAPRPAASTGGTALPLLARLGFNSAALAVMSKDWRTRRRDLVMVMRMVLPVLALGLLAFRGGGALHGFTHIQGGPLAASIALAPIPLVTLGLATALGLTSMSLEGGAIWIYVVSPNSLSPLLLGKVLVAAPPVAVAAVVTAVFTEVVVHPGIGWAVPAIFLAAVFGGSLAVVMVAVGGLFPRFNWTDPRRMISPVGAWVALVAQLGMVVMVGALVLAGILLGRLGLLPAGAAYGGGLLLAAAGCLGTALVAISAAGARLTNIEYGRGIAEQSLS
jgi:hypothetical protein